jgi:hypothetical protein
MTIRIRPSIVLFGDSLTELAFGEEVGSSSVGWASLLASAYSRHADELNRGFRGALQYGSRALASCRGCLSNNNKAKGVIVMAKHSFVPSFSEPTIVRFQEKCDINRLKNLVIICERLLGPFERVSPRLQTTTRFHPLNC